MISKKLTNSGLLRESADKHSIYTGNAHDSIPCYCWAKTTRHPGGQQQPWSSQSHVRRADQHGTRKMAIPAMANRIICVKIASASLALAPTTCSFLPSDVRRLRTCCVSASPCAGFAVRWAQPDVAIALHGGMLYHLPR